MSNSNQDDNLDDDVVVIEERDRRSYLYIAVAGVLGLALGGLIGSSVTANKWQSTYIELQQQYRDVQQDKIEMANKVETRVANVDFEVENKLKAKVAEFHHNHQLELEELHRQISELKDENGRLLTRIEDQQLAISDAEQQNNKLNQQADMQVSLLERSRELFQRELKVKQQLESLQKELKELEPKLDAFKVDCNAYLEGTSWEVKSDSCDKQDEVSSRISQINQMINVHQMDLEQIKAIAEQLGLE